MDRRTSIQWVLAASAALPFLEGQWARAQGSVPGPATGSAGAAAGSGYGTDPNLVPPHPPGEYWPLTLSASQRRLAAVLCDLIIPADEHSPAASTVGVVDFIDEWVSAPYPDMRSDRTMVLDGLAWLDAEAQRRHGREFAVLERPLQHAICDDICEPARATPERSTAAQFFARYRDLTAGGFYSSPAGRQDLGYIGNVPLARFDGAPVELLKKLNLT
ncbi:MAG TPA: gluconate 2-dehydrogenase subunit 3 family protein [Steroidobacteraceae bacterium]|nr:gluconate 2-dehydrogenase subunit 3 family protein [Steroidobacteraceae bacterium]